MSYEQALFAEMANDYLSSAYTLSSTEICGFMKTWSSNLKWQSLGIEVAAKSLKLFDKAVTFPRRQCRSDKICIASTCALICFELKDGLI